MIKLTVLGTVSFFVFSGKEKFKYAKALNFLFRISATKAITCVILHLNYVE
jgi:hypothetical protein